MARLVLALAPPMLGGDASSTITVEETTSYQTPTGPKLGSDLVVGDGIGFGTMPSWRVIQTITPEA